MKISAGPIDDAPTQGPNQSFDIDAVMSAVQAAVREMPLPSMFQLAAEGFRTPFEQLVACIISIRTMEETSLPVSRRLFAIARSPAELAALSEAEIESAIHESTFSERKAIQIRAIARTIVSRHGGELPCDRTVMESFAGVGPKCSSLALGIACAAPTIPVDIHVHRVTNRWGYVSTSTPEQTMEALSEVLPLAYRPGINKALVPFGKSICRGVRPRCSTCPVLRWCPQIGVSSHI